MTQIDEPISHRDEAAQVIVLHQRILALLEELPSPSSACVTRSALLRAAEIALARNDWSESQKLFREAKLLVDALRRSREERSSSVGISDAARVRSHSGLGVGHCGKSKSRPSSWRRPHAPIQYPYGEPPTGWDTRLHDSTISMPDSRLSTDCVARLRAFRRALALAQAEEAEARRRLCTVE